MYVYVYMPEDKTFGEFYEKKICQKEKINIILKMKFIWKFVSNMKYMNYIRFLQYFLPRWSYQRNYIQQKIHQ